MGYIAETGGGRGLTQTAKLRSRPPVMERVPAVEFGKEGKVAVSGEQEFNAVGETDRRNPSIVHDGSPYSRPLNQDAQDLQKIVRLTNKAIAWRFRPGLELLPGMLRRSGCFPPDTVICHDA